MDLSTFIIIAILILSNGYLIYSENRRRKEEQLQLAKLKQDKIAKGVEEKDIDEDDLKDEIEPKQKYSWIFGIIVCLDIWIIGAVATHWWATTFFADGVVAQTGESSDAASEISNAATNQGLFGDSFGAVNALVSAFAFAGMIVAFILQRYELRLQRKELRDNRTEMERQTAQFKDQNQNLLIQRFESTFFHMLELQQQIVNELSTNQTEEIMQDMWDGGISFSKIFHIDENIRGRNLFYHAFCNIIHEVPTGKSIEVEKLRGMNAVLKKGGLSLYEEMTTPTYFDHYFRHLYTILQFIDKEDKKEGDERLFSEEELYGYAKIVRATLSRYELVWLYYNGLSGYGNEKLKPLIERYCMLKNLRTELLSLCSDNQEELAKRGLPIDMVKQEEYTGTDYEFFLTSEYKIKTKYHISAFYKSFKEQAEGLKLVKDWDNYLSEAVQ